MTKNNKTILFGAGADSFYDICTGKDFSKALLLNDLDKSRKQLLGSEYSQFKLIHPNSKRVFLQTIESNRDVAETIWDNNTIDTCIRYYNSYSKKGISDRDKETIDKFCQECYGIISNNTTVDKNEEIFDFFMKKTVFFDVLDEKFNALRKLPLNSNGKRVINTYVTIFLLMLNQLYHIDNNFVYSYENIFELLGRKYDKIDWTTESYYIKLKNIAKKFNIVTTNYTDIAEKITGEDCVYLHGNLKWFEDYKNLTVYDCTKEDELHKLKNNQYICPFILIPSGIKPLICKKELDEFFKFSGILDFTEELYVIGYNFNMEDNHINALILDKVRRGMIVYYFNFIEDANKYGGKSEIEKFSWYQDVKNNIIIININRDNCLSKFYEIVCENKI